LKRIPTRQTTAASFQIRSIATPFDDEPDRVGFYWVYRKGARQLVRFIEFSLELGAFAVGLGFLSRSHIVMNRLATLYDRRLVFSRVEGLLHRSRAWPDLRVEPARRSPSRRHHSATKTIPWL
jgi:hypothetical protein